MHFFKKLVLLCLLLSSLGFSQSTLVVSTHVYNVRYFGATGNGVTNDYQAIQDGLNTVASNHGTLYFPCGTYLIDSPLLLTAPQSPNQTGAIVGESIGCAIILYAGTTAAPVLTVTTGVNAAYFSGFTLKDLTILGNTNTTDIVYLVRPTNYIVENVETWGANATSGECMQIFSGIGGKLDTYQCNVLGTPLESHLPVPHNGLHLNGVSAGDQTGAMTILNPIIQSVSGIALSLQDTSLVFIDGCQMSSNNQSLNIASSSFKNNIVDCLFEDSPTASYIGGYNNVLDNDTFSYFNGGVGTVNVQLDGTANTLSNALVEWGLSILPSAQQAKLSNVDLGFYPTDAGKGTKMDNVYFGNQVEQVGFPQSIDNTYTVPGYSGSGATSAEKISGSWVFGTGTALLSPTIFPVGASWRAIFLGKFGGAGSTTELEAMPTFTELTETSNTVVMPSTATLTFAINSSGLFSVTGGSGGETFNGTIILTTDTTSATSGPNSMKLAGGISLGGPIQGFQALAPISNNTGFQIATVATCAVNATPLNPCSVIVPLPVTEPDTNYKVSGCMVDSGNSIPFIVGSPYDFGTESFSLFIFSAGYANSTGTVTCIVTH
jgi:Pectate lyase superfamily protein